MPLSEKKIKNFLAIQSHERFAKLFISESQTKTIIFSKKEMYIYNKEFKYYEPVDLGGRFIPLVSGVLHATIEPWADHFSKKLADVVVNKELDKEEKDEIKDQLKVVQKQISNAIKSIETTTFIKNVVDQIASLLVMTVEEQEKLNTCENCLNFRNGKLDLKTSEFSERTQDDFVTEYLNYDFQPKPNKAIKKEVSDILKQICNSNEDDYDFIMNFLSYCITSETKEQKYLNVVGPSASNGKSTLIKLMESAFSIYIFKAKKDLFTEGFSKGHKFFAQTKNKRIVYIEEQDKKKQDTDLMKDIIDGNKINNEVLFSTTEKINIFFKLLFFSNNLMNFDADSGIKRRLIHFEFKNKFVDKNDYEKEKEKHTIGQVFVVDRNLISKFNDNDDYKNVLIHLLLARSKNYFEKGLIIPDKYVEISNGVCEDNDKFKNFIDNNFDITRVESDRMHVDEFMDMYNRHSKCNFAWSTVHSDLKRLGIEFNRDARKIVNGVSLKRCILGIRPKEANEEVQFVEETKVKQSDLDYGLSVHPEVRVKELENEIREEKKRYCELSTKFDEMKEERERIKLEFESYKKLNPPQLKAKAAIRLIDDSDSEEEGENIDIRQNKIAIATKAK
jgi:phage/plasmid-associated DNA primase